jgi:hypothetical protein
MILLCPVLRTCCHQNGAVSAVLGTFRMQDCLVLVALEQTIWRLV